MAQDRIREAFEQLVAAANVLAQELIPEREWELTLGVKSPMVDLLVEHAGALVHSTLYQDPDEEYVIDSATIRLGAVTLRAQRPSRPATDEEREQAKQAKEIQHKERAFRSYPMHMGSRGGDR
jgi:hypothetical protein